MYEDFLAPREKKSVPKLAFAELFSKVNFLDFVKSDFQNISTNNITNTSTTNITGCILIFLNFIDPGIQNLLVSCFSYLEQ